MKVRNRKVILRMICILAVLFTAAYTVFRFYCKQNEKEAKEIAIKHLESVYSEQMDYISTRRSWIDPDMYHVYFCETNNPNLKFEVEMMADFVLPENPDNYLLKYFAFHVSDELQKLTEQVWEEKITNRVVINGQPLYGFRVAEELQEYMPVEEMAPYIKYTLVIDVEKSWKEEEKEAEAYRMYEVIRQVQTSGYLPERILFSYQSGSGESKFFKYEEWQEIEDVLQIEKELE